MCKSAELIIATTPLEKEYLTALGWNSHISLIRYFGYSQLTSQSAMTEDWHADNYDEDVIHAELTKQKLDMYAAAVFDAMTEKTGLTEGFMPLPARKGRKSRQILKYIK